MRALDPRWIVSIALVTVVALAALRAPPPVDSHPVRVVVGTSGLIDGYHVVYGPAFQADWTARAFWLSSGGTFRVSLKNEYLSEDPRYASGSGTEVALTLVGSAILFQARAVFRHLSFGDWTHFPLHPLVAVACDPSAPRVCSADVEGPFEIPRAAAYEELDYIEVQLSWIRVFRDPSGALYFQWLQGDGGAAASSDRVVRNLHGHYLVYYPLSEDRTTPLLPEEFDYVAWLKANLSGPA